MFVGAGGVADELTGGSTELAAQSVEVAVVEDDAAPSPFDEASNSLRGRDLRRVLESLPDRERQVIEMRFGLTGGEPRTLEEVGREFGVTRERIRQIESKTLRKLAHLPEAQSLRDSA